MKFHVPSMLTKGIETRRNRQKKGLENIKAATLAAVPVETVLVCCNNPVLEALYS